MVYTVAKALQGIWQCGDLIAKVLQERVQLVTAAVHIANDVERSVLVLAVAPDRLALHHRGLDLCRRGQDKDMAKTFTLEMAQRTAQLLALVAHDVRPKGALRTLAVALLTELLRQVEHDGHWQTVILTRQRHERLARLRLDIRGIHDREAPSRQALGSNEAQDLKGVPGGCLVVFIIADQTAADIGCRISVARKCRRAKVDLPAPEGPTSTTRANSGMVSWRAGMLRTSPTLVSLSQCLR